MRIKMNEIDWDALELHRKANFKAELNESRDDTLKEENKSLTITTNGYQWQTINITKSEAMIIVNLLTAWLNNK